MSSFGVELKNGEEGIDNKAWFYFTRMLDAGTMGDDEGDLNRVISTGSTVLGVVVAGLLISSLCRQFPRAAGPSPAWRPRRCRTHRCCHRRPPARLGRLVRGSEKGRRTRFRPSQSSRRNPSAAGPLRSSWPRPRSAVPSAPAWCAGADSRRVAPLPTPVARRTATLARALPTPAAVCERTLLGSSCRTSAASREPQSGAALFRRIAHRTVAGTLAVSSANDTDAGSARIPAAPPTRRRQSSSRSASPAPFRTASGTNSARSGGFAGTR